MIKVKFRAVFLVVALFSLSFCKVQSSGFSPAGYGEPSQQTNFPYENPSEQPSMAVAPFSPQMSMAPQMPMARQLPPQMLAAQAMPLQNSESGDLQLLAIQEKSLKAIGGYNSYLALEYLAFARRLAAVQDEKSADYFAKKGLRAAAAQNVIPENPTTWKADPAQIEEMVAMQKRLENVLVKENMKLYLPIQSAHLSYLYDCWVSSESRVDSKAAGVGQCQLRFAKLINEIERWIEESKSDKTPKVKIIEPEFERFEIFFDLDNHKLNDRANKSLIAVLNHLQTLEGNYRILLVGNADRTGSSLYNEVLSLRRAETIKNYLQKNGVKGDLIQMRSVGEDFPDIVTRDGTQQQINRSVAIYVLKGYGSFSLFPLPLLENIVYREEIEKARKSRQ